MTRRHDFSPATRGRDVVSDYTRHFQNSNRERTRRNRNNNNNNNNNTLLLKRLLNSILTVLETMINRHETILVRFGRRMLFESELNCETCSKRDGMIKQRESSRYCNITCFSSFLSSAFSRKSVRGSDRGHKNAGRARLRVGWVTRHGCFTADSFVRSE